METPGYRSKVIPVPAFWQDVYSHFYYAANHSGDTLHKTLLPTFQTILVFNFDAPIHFSLGDGPVLTAAKTVVLGPIKQAFTYAMTPGATMLVVNFKWDAFYRFFGQSLQHYADLSQHPINSHCFATLWQELKVSDETQRVQRILDFSATYLRNQETAATRLVDGNLQAEALWNPVKYIAGATKQNARTVQLHYQKYFGYSAREKSRHQRFTQAVQLLNELQTQGRGDDWFEIMDTCGYYDQSHMIHDFTHFLGISPTQYLRLQENICIAGS